MSDMTAEDVRVQVSVLAAAKGVDASDIEALTLQEATLLAEGYREANALRDAEAFDKFIAFLQEAVLVAGPLATLASALTGGVGLVGAMKGL